MCVVKKNVSEVMLLQKIHNCKKKSKGGGRPFKPISFGAGFEDSEKRFFLFVQRPQLHIMHTYVNNMSRYAASHFLKN